MHCVAMDAAALASVGGGECCSVKTMKSRLGFFFFPYNIKMGGARGLQIIAWD